MPALGAVLGSRIHEHFAHDGQLTTRNRSDVEDIGLKLINPWDLDGQHP